MKVFFLIDSTFSERDFVRFGIDTLVRNNVQVYLWDFSLLRKSKIDLSAFEEDLDFKKINRYVFKDFQKLNEKINDVKNAFLFDLRSEVYEIYNLCWFQSYGAITVKFDQTLTPLLGWRPSIKDYLIILRNYIVNEGSIASISKVLRYLNNNFFKNKKECYDIKVCSGSNSQCNNGEFEIRSHSFDYDIYLQEKNKKLKTKDYIVFLDNGMTDHPDYEKLGIAPYCTDSDYFPLLRSFFNKVEKQTGLQIIVAVHPRLNIDKSMYKNFGNRQLISGKSAEIVRGSNFVIAHDSTSINFAILWNIPLLIVTTNQIEKRIYHSMEAITNALKIKRLNINNSYDNLDFLKIAREPITQYNNFVDKYIKVNNSPKQNSAQILFKGLNKYVR